MIFSIAIILRNWAYETDDCTWRQIYFRQNCLWRQKSTEKNMVLFGTNLFQITDCVSVPTFYHFFDHLWLLLENSPFKNLWRINCLGCNFVQCGRIHFTLTKIINKLISTKIESLFHWLALPKLENRSWFKIGYKLEQFNQSLAKFAFFNQHSQSLHNAMQKEIKNPEFVQGVNFEFIDSLNNNGTK